MFSRPSSTAGLDSSPSNRSIHASSRLRTASRFSRHAARMWRRVSAGTTALTIARDRSSALWRSSIMSSRRSRSSIRWLSIACSSGHRAHRRAKSDPQCPVLHFRALGGCIQEESWQDEVTAPAAHLQHQLVGLARQADLLLRSERQLEREYVPVAVAGYRIRPSAIEELARVGLGEERLAQFGQPLEANHLLVEKRDRPNRHGRELLHDHR